eukprot:3819571-Rhodomonas_salina.3
MDEQQATRGWEVTWSTMSTVALTPIETPSLVAFAPISSCPAPPLTARRKGGKSGEEERERERERGRSRGGERGVDLLEGLDFGFIVVGDSAAHRISQFETPLQRVLLVDP